MEKPPWLRTREASTPNHQVDGDQEDKSQHPGGGDKAGGPGDPPQWGTDPSSSCPAPQSTALLMEVKHSLRAFHTWFSRLEFHTSEEL